MVTFLNGSGAGKFAMEWKKSINLASNSAGLALLFTKFVAVFGLELFCPFRNDWFLVGGVGGVIDGGTGGASLVCGTGCCKLELELEEVEPRCGKGGGGGGIEGALHGGGGATLVIGTLLLLVPFVFETGGEGGLTPGGLRARVTGLGWGSYKTSLDWWKDGGAGANTGGERVNLILWALDTLLLVIKLNFFGGGDGFCCCCCWPGGFGATVGLP